MAILVVAAVAVVAGLARGGTIGNLATLNIRWRGIIIAGFLLQVLAFSEFWQQRADLYALTSAVYLLSLILLLVALAANLRLPGLRLIALGFFSNVLVIALNGGYMPSGSEARALAGRTPLEPGQVASNSIGMGMDTRLALLGDIFALPWPAFLRNVYSVGDVLIAVGAFYLIYTAVRTPGAVKDHP